MKKLVSFLLLCTMLFATFTGCSKGSQQADSATNTSDNQQGTVSSETPEDLSETGTLKLAWVSGIGTDTMFECPYGDIKSLYPNMLFSFLVKSSPDGTYVCDLATEYEVSDDGKTYTFHLNPDAKFSDGTPVTAEDVQFSISSAVAYEKSWLG